MERQLSRIVSDQKQTMVRIGTRSSELARLQTDMVMNALSGGFPQMEFQIVHVTTSGDKVRDRPIADLGTRGVFVKELEEALLADEVDLVVHSLKDLPTDLPDGLALAAVMEREDPRDVLVSNGMIPFSDLPTGAKVATSSRRRAAQLRALRPDLSFIDIRGNIPTRLRKHDEGHCDAMVLAAAGLIRLGMTDRITQYFEPDVSTPAVGQGALGIECRSQDKRILELLKTIDNRMVRAQVSAERAFLDELGGGCSVPIGGLATIGEDGMLHLLGCVAAIDGSEIYRSSLSAQMDDAIALGKGLAAQMLGTGAKEVLDSLRVMTSSMVSPP